MDRGQEIRELKLGASFTNSNARASYHTLKYDFKPASVDAHKEATLETGSNSQVTVTVPHLDGSGVPNTIFKGSARDYTKKECVLIFNRETNEIILEKLCGNIQVKKTRTDSTNKQPQQAPPPAIIAPKSGLENQTTRQSSKTRVSTGTSRKNVLHFVPKHSPHQQQQQGSPSYHPHPHRSPQQQPPWNANNNTSTLPSITSLLDDNNFANNQPPPQQQQQPSSNMYNNNNNKNNNINNNNNCNISNNISSTPSTASNVLPKATSAIQNQQQQHQQTHQMVVDDIGVLSSSESSSDSNDDDSDSDSSNDSADSVDNHPMNNNNSNNIVHMPNHNSNSMNSMNMNVNMNMNIANHKKAPTSMTNNHHLDNNSKAQLLTKDLCLSDSNSDSDY
ncbi:unnamed protein product [Chironomus riparius]|uniref:Ell-associated factor Eaf n=1 Tax=Chironomus riparius TaxID=315576 RepID=A0A9N9RY42_9DIPT|nr:unnamed protein product [Chironomus riparius]